MSGHIVVVGSLNIDLVVRTPRYPEPGETIQGTDFHTFPGGKGANQAIAAARLGASVKMIGRVGQDAFGQTLLKTAEKDGVDTRFVKQDSQAPTGVASILVDESGQNSIVIVPGANARLSPDDLLQAEEVFEGAAVVLLQLEIPLATVSKAVEIAQTHGTKIVLSPAPARPLSKALLSKIDYLIPNEGELALLSGVEGIETGISCLRGLGVEHLIVTLGESGALVAEKKHQYQLPAIPVTVVDTTAAGDAFVGAFAVALTEGLPLQQAAAWGNAAGALSVTKSGANPSLPTRQALMAFMQEHQQA